METKLTLKREECKRLDAEADKFIAKAEAGEAFTDEELVRSEQVIEEKEKVQREIRSLEMADKAKSLVRSNSFFDNGSAPVIKTKTKASDEDTTNAFRAWALNGTPERKTIKDEWLRSADALDIDYKSDQFLIRAQSTDTNSEGGYSKNGSIFKSIVEAKSAFGGIEKVATVYHDDFIEDMHFVTNNDLGNGPTAPVTENYANVDDPTVFGLVTLKHWPMQTAIFPISYQMLKYSRVGNLESYFGKLLGRRLAYKANYDFTRGIGNTEPSGVINGAVILANAGLDFADFEAAHDYVDEEYLNSPSACWMMSREHANATNHTLLTSSSYPNGRSFEDSPVKNILGFPIVINNALDNHVLFGDFSHHMCRYVGDIFLEKEKIQTKFAIGIYAGMMIDSAFVNPGNNPLVGWSVDPS